MTTMKVLPPHDGEYGICRFPPNHPPSMMIPASFVLIQDEIGTWLCHCCRRRENPNESDTFNQINNKNHDDVNLTIIAYTRSIQVLDCDTTTWQIEDDARRIRIALNVDPCIFPPQPSKYSSQYHYGRMIVSPKKKFSKEEEFTMGTMTFLTQSAVPILALSMQIRRATKDDNQKKTDHRIQDDDTWSSPLLLACIKRQLMGCPIMFGSNSTVLTVSGGDTDQTWNCHVQSVQIMPPPPSSSSEYNYKEQREMTLGMIYPSTRITLHLREEESTPESPSPSTTTSSLAEQLLRDTLHSIHAGQLHVPRFFLWTGPPGVGKTYSVQQVMPYCHLQSFRGAATTLSSLKAQSTTITTTNKKNHNNDSKPTLFFFDECDALASTEEGAAMLAYWLDEWSSSSFVVVAATNRIDDLPASLRRRFHQEMHFAPPTTMERCTILQQLLQQWWPAAGDMTTRQDLQSVADLCVGYVAADLAALVRQASLAHILDAGKALADTLPRTTTKDYLMHAMQQVGASALRDAAMTAPLTTTSWDDIAGEAGGAKKALRQAIEWPRTKRKEYELLGLTPPRGILLHGPPGCAKTSLARAAAGAAGVAFVSLAPADVYASSYVGDAEAIVRRSFDLARSAAPCVLFFDEIDAILGVMSEDGNHDGGAGGLARGHSAEARVLSTFLNEMDGVDGTWNDGVLVLGATNRPWTLDAALLRPGRFDKIIYVPPPDREGRRAILEMQTRNWRKNSNNIENDDPIDIDYLSSDAISGNMTGAEIKGACQEAAMNALGEYAKGGSPAAVVHQKDLLDALSSIKPLLSNPCQMDGFRLFEGKRRNRT